VVVLQAAGAEALAAQIEQRFGVRATALDGQVRVEIENGHRFIADVVEAFPGAIESVGLHKPSLEDVFMKETGAAIE
jgi:ABC-2 type transport system ATP-binding protein